MIDGFVQKRNERSITLSGHAHALLRSSPVSGRLEVLLASQYDFHGSPEFVGGSRGERCVRPRPQFPAEAGAEELRDDADVLATNTKHRAKNPSAIVDGLARLVECELVVVPDRDRCVEFDGIVSLNGSGVRLTDLDGRRSEGRLGVAATALFLGFTVRREVVRDLRRFHVGVGNAHGGCGGRCLFERFGHNKRDVLPVVANRIVGKRRTCLVGDPGIRRGFV